MSKKMCIVSFVGAVVISFFVGGLAMMWYLPTQVKQVEVVKEKIVYMTPAPAPALTAHPDDFGHKYLSSLNDFYNKSIQLGEKILTVRPRVTTKGEIILTSSSTPTSEKVLKVFDLFANPLYISTTTDKSIVVVHNGTSGGEVGNYADYYVDLATGKFVNINYSFGESSFGVTTHTGVEHGLALEYDMKSKNEMYGTISFVGIMVDKTTVYQVDSPMTYDYELQSLGLPGVDFEYRLAKDLRHVYLRIEEGLEKQVRFVYDIEKNTLKKIDSIPQGELLKPMFQP